MLQDKRMNSTHPIEILLVEDNPADVALAKEALREGRVASRLNAVGDVDEALAFLQRQGNHSQSPHPDLILLDLKLPGRHGLEFLAEIKADKSLRKIPVIVLTNSDAPEDILGAYQLQASCYITKPADLANLERVMNSIQDFSLTVVKLPPHDGIV
jgi:two-component system response regulator